MALLIGNGTFFCFHLDIDVIFISGFMNSVLRLNQELFIYLFIIYFCPCYDSRDLLDACFIYLSMFILLHYFLDAMKLNNPAVCDNNKNILFNF